MNQSDRAASPSDAPGTEAPPQMDQPSSTEAAAGVNEDSCDAKVAASAPNLAGWTPEPQPYNLPPAGPDPWSMCSSPLFCHVTEVPCIVNRYFRPAAPGIVEFVQANKGALQLTYQEVVPMLLRVGCVKCKRLLLDGLQRVWMSMYEGCAGHTLNEATAVHYFNSDFDIAALYRSFAPHATWDQEGAFQRAGLHKTHATTLLDALAGGLQEPTPPLPAEELTFHQFIGRDVRQHLASGLRLPAQLDHITELMAAMQQMWQERWPGFRGPVTPVQVMEAMSSSSTQPILPLVDKISEVALGLMQLRQAVCSILGSVRRLVRGAIIIDADMPKPRQDVLLTQLHDLEVRVDALVLHDTLAAAQAYSNAAAAIHDLASDLQSAPQLPPHLVEILNDPAAWAFRARFAGFIPPDSVANTPYLRATWMIVMLHIFTCLQSAQAETAVRSAVTSLAAFLTDNMSWLQNWNSRMERLLNLCADHAVAHARLERCTKLLCLRNVVVPAVLDRFSTHAIFCFDRPDDTAEAFATRPITSVAGILQPAPPPLSVNDAHGPCFAMRARILCWEEELRDAIGLSEGRYCNILDTVPSTNAEVLRIRKQLSRIRQLWMQHWAHISRWKNRMGLDISTDQAACQTGQYVVVAEEMAELTRRAWSLDALTDELGVVFVWLEAMVHTAHLRRHTLCDAGPRQIHVTQNLTAIISFMLWQAAEQAAFKRAPAEYWRITQFSTLAAQPLEEEESSTTAPTSSLQSAAVGDADGSKKRKKRGKRRVDGAVLQSGEASGAPPHALVPQSGALPFTPPAVLMHALRWPDVETVRYQSYFSNIHAHTLAVLAGAMNRKVHWICGFHPATLQHLGIRVPTAFRQHYASGTSELQIADLEPHLVKDYCRRVLEGLATGQRMLLQQPAAVSVSQFVLDKAILLASQGKIAQLDVEPVPVDGVDDDAVEAANKRKAADELEARRRQQADEARRKKLAEEEEAARQKQAAEDARRKRQAEDEARRKRQAEEEAARKQAEDERQRKAAEEDAARQRKAAEEEARRKKQAAEEEARKRKAAAEEEVRRKKAAAEDEARRKKAAAEEETRRKKAAEEEARRKKAAEDEARRKKAADDEAARKKKTEEEAAARRKRAAEEEAARKRAAEEQAARKKAAEEQIARKKAAEEDAARKRAAQLAAEAEAVAKRAAEQARLKELAEAEEADALASITVPDIVNSLFSDGEFEATPAPAATTTVGAVGSPVGPATSTAASAPWQTWTNTQSLFDVAEAFGAPGDRTEDAGVAAVTRTASWGAPAPFHWGIPITPPLYSMPSFGIEPEPQPLSGTVVDDDDGLRRLPFFNFLHHDEPAAEQSLVADMLDDTDTLPEWDVDRKEFDFEAAALAALVHGDDDDDPTVRPHHKTAPAAVGTPVDAPRASAASRAPPGFAGARPSALSTGSFLGLSRPTTTPAESSGANQDGRLTAAQQSALKELSLIATTPPTDRLSFDAQDPCSCEQYLSMFMRTVGLMEGAYNALSRASAASSTLAALQLFMPSVSLQQSSVVATTLKQIAASSGSDSHELLHSCIVAHSHILQHMCDSEEQPEESVVNSAFAMAVADVFGCEDCDATWDCGWNGRSKWAFTVELQDYRAALRSNPKDAFTELLASCVPAVTGIACEQPGCRSTRVWSSRRLAHVPSILTIGFASHADRPHITPSNADTSEILASIDVWCDFRNLFPEVTAPIPSQLVGMICYTGTDHTAVVFSRRMGRWIAVSVDDTVEIGVSWQATAKACVAGLGHPILLFYQTHPSHVPLPTDHSRFMPDERHVRHSSDLVTPTKLSFAGVAAGASAGGSSTGSAGGAKRSARRGRGNKPGVADSICSECGSSGHLSKSCPRVTCHRCGQVGHMSSACTVQPRTCNNCGKTGHIMKKCPKIRCNACHKLGHMMDDCPHHK